MSKTPVHGRPIQVWAWRDAPEEFRKLSTHGGDEDWVGLVPGDTNDIPLWMEFSPFTVCSSEEYTHPDWPGYVVVISAHA